jgi:hypothetical protein
MLATPLTFSIPTGLQPRLDFLHGGETCGRQIQRNQCPRLDFSQCCAFCAARILPLARFRDATVVSSPLSART